MRKNLLFFSLLLVGLCFPAVASERAVVFSENFDAFSAGSESAPDAVEVSSGGQVDPSLTHGVQWNGRGLHQAGGCVAVLHFLQDQNSVQGYLHTPYADVRLDGGNFTLRFRAKSIDADGAKVHIEVYDPYTTNSLDAAVVEISSDWKTYEIALAHPGYGNHLAYMQIASDGDDWLLDDFEIVQTYEGLMPPITHFAKNVTYEQFTANWNAVPLATGYLLSAFSIDADENRDYVVKDVPVSGCEYTVEGTEKGKKYFYTVRSVNDRYTSEESEPYEVYVPLSSLERPVTLPASDFKEHGFTANWEPVFRAMGYIVTLIRKHVAVADEEFVVLHEDFNKCTGYADYPDYAVPFYYNLDDYTNMPGWKEPATAVMAEGKFGIDNYWKKYEGVGVLTSPSLDLSRAGGHFNVKLSVVGVKGNTVTVECDGVKESYKLTAKKETFALQFANGSADTVLKFYFDGDDKLLFDDIVISQDIHAGECITENVGVFNTVDERAMHIGDEAVTSYEFDGLEFGQGDSFVYTVKAWSWSLGEDGVWGPTVYSQESEPCKVPMSGAAGVEDIADATFSMRVDGGNIIVNTPVTETMEIYDVAGMLRGRYDLPEGESVVTAPARGVLIVRAGSYTARVMVR